MYLEMGDFFIFKNEFILNLSRAHKIMKYDEGSMCAILVYWSTDEEQFDIIMYDTEEHRDDDFGRLMKRIRTLDEEGA